MGRFILPQSPSSHNKIIAWLTGILTLLLALFAFILSFNALTDLATKHYFSIPFLFPLVVEASVVIFSLNALYRSMQGESAKWQWCLIIGSSVSAGGFNILHAQPDLVSRVMAAMPSLFLLLSFETFIGQLKYTVTRTNTVQNIEQLKNELNSKRQELDTLIDAKQSELNRLNTEADTLGQLIKQSQLTFDQLKLEIEQSKRAQDSNIEQAQGIKATRDALVIEQRRGELLNILSDEGDIGVSAFANRLHSSRGTVYSDLKALSEAGQIMKNGNGWEVVQ